MQQNQYELLTKKRFLPIFITQFLQAFNDNVFKTALVTLIAFQAGMTITKMQIYENFAVGLFIIPFFLFSATAGQLADKFEKSRYIRIIKLIEIGIMGVSLLFLLHGNLVMLMLMLLFTGTHSAFFGPVKYSILPDHLHEDELIGANALVEASTFVAILVGTIIGGSFIAGHHGPAIVGTMMLVVAVGGFISSLFIPSSPMASPDLKLNFHIFEETRNIIEYTRNNRDVYHSILGISWFWLIGVTCLTQFPIYTKDIINGTSSVLTLFLTLFSVGIAIGSLICNKLLDGEITSKYVPLGVFGMSVFMFDFYSVSMHLSSMNHLEPINWLQFLKSWSHIHIALDVLLLSVCGGIYLVPLYAIMQTRSETSFRSRAIACSNILGAFFMVMSTLTVMVLYKMGMTVTQIFLAAAVFNTIAAVYICKLLPEAVVRSFVNWLLIALYKVEVKGLDNYKAAGDRVIIIANHTSFLDIILLSAFLPDKFTIAINTYIAQKWWIKPLLSLANTFPVNPTNPMATKSIIKVIRGGEKCIIFPEGRLTVTGALMKVYEGPAMIADRSGAMLLPIRIEGAQYTLFSRMRGKVRIHWFPKITMTIMPAQQFSATPDLRGRARRRFMGNKLYNIMTDMIFESSDYRQTLFSALLDARAIHHGRTKILEDAERKPLSYNQFVMRCFILGKEFSRHSKGNDYVGLMMPTSNAAAICFFALQAYGRIPAMINFTAGPSTIIASCKMAAITRIYTSRLFVTTAKLEELVDKLTQSGIEIIFLEDLRHNVGRIDKLRGFLATFFAPYEYARQTEHVTPDSPAVLLFTSGSEGSPKGVVLSHSNLLANCYQMQSRVDFTSRDLIFNALPVFHCFGLTAGMIFPLVSGTRAFFYPSPLHYRVVPELIYDTSATIMFGTDTFLNGYAKFAHNYDFYSIRYIFAGAEKLKEETRKLYADKFGVRLFEGYGATETAPVISMNTPMQNLPGSVGRMLPGMEARLVPVPGITDGGRLSVRGPNVMLGYLSQEEPREIEPNVEGWHDTGDIVSIDSDGYITIKGRAKRFAKIGGEMVSLTLIETVVATVWPEHRHAVISIPDAKRGEQIVLVTNHREATREAIIAHVKYVGMSELSVPKKILVVKDVPILASGKVDYPAVEVLVESLGG